MQVLFSSPLYEKNAMKDMLSALGKVWGGVKAIKGRLSWRDDFDTVLVAIFTFPSKSAET